MGSLTSIVLVLVPQLYRTFCDSMDCSPPGSSVHGILQARVLDWVAIPFSTESSQPRDWTQVSCIAGGLFTVWAARETSWGANKSHRGPGCFKWNGAYALILVLVPIKCWYQSKFENHSLKGLYKLFHWINFKLDETFHVLSLINRWKPKGYKLQIQLLNLYFFYEYPDLMLNYIL